MHTKVELIAVDRSGIGLAQCIHVSITIGNGDCLRVFAPEVRDVEADREALQHFPTNTDISLTETAIARISLVVIGVSRRLIVIIVVSVIIAVAYIRIRYDTKATTHFRQQAEGSNSIVEGCRFGIHTATTFLEIGDLTRHASIENHGQRVNC